MSGSEIRETFLKFFETKGHRRVHSSSLVPHNDPTLLFTNAGMNQFKDVFLGNERRDYNRATTSQKCVRAGGKHNDLENVGFTRRHHTFFEMLGNFSFGDYFKREAIAYAWELCTSDDWFGIPKDKLYVTIFEGADGVPRDDEAEKFWMEVGVPKERIFAMGPADNFWAMGDTGPCGPCSEIFYDMGIGASETPDRDLPFPQDDARYVEIWNLVFMQFERFVDYYSCKIHPEVRNSIPVCEECRKDPSGMHGHISPVFLPLVPLPKPSIDTGMGLERTAAVLQCVISNFETDLFTPLIERAAELLGVKNDVGNASLRIIADHARAATFLVADGVQPANEGRGYVLRKILRRAFRHVRLLGVEQPVFYMMTAHVIAMFGNRSQTAAAPYPELLGSADRIEKVLYQEETQFARVLEAGLTKLEQAFAEVAAPTSEAYYLKMHIDPDIARRLANAASSMFSNGKLVVTDEHEVRKRFREAAPEFVGPLPETIFSQDLLSGQKAFNLYETYGLPVDFMKDAAHDAGIRFDDEGFEQARATEQARARASWKGGSQKSASPVYRDIQAGRNPYAYTQSVTFPEKLSLEFLGYTDTRIDGARILAILSPQAPGDVPMLEAQAGQHCRIVLDRTPFYAQSGGQIGDTGWLISEDHNEFIADVTDTTMPLQSVRVSSVLPRATLRVGQIVDAQVDVLRRNATRRNHTGTHLLHAGLREVLGKHVKQAGSLVDDHRLRFDFSHFTAIADEELQDIEDLINKEVLANTSVVTLEDVPIDVAVNEYHAMALFGEKYGEKVRVVKIGDFSTELCGGTHTAATGEIGTIKLLGEGSVSSGVRRVEAVTGLGALKEFRRDFAVAQLANQLAPSIELSPADSLRQKLAANEEELKKLRRELDEARMKSAASSVSSAADQAVEVKGVKVLAQKVGALDRGQLRTLVDNLRNRIGSGVVVLGSVQEDGRVAIIVGVTKDLTAKLQAGKIINPVAKHVGGSGGGRPDMAEAGGKDANQLDAALASAPEVVRSLLDEA
jgi:alanyl-tRNA synthetase